jgi:TonB family protein
MVAVSLLLHATFIGIALFATILFKPDGPVDLEGPVVVDLVSNIGGSRPGNSMMGGAKSSVKQNPDDMPKPEVKETSAELPTKDFPQEPKTSSAEKIGKKEDVELPPGKVLKEDLKPPSREVKETPKEKETPKVKDEPVPIAEKQAPKPKKEKPEERKVEPVKVAKREEAFSAEKIREERLRQMEDTLSDGKPPPAPAREPPPIPRETLPQTFKEPSREEDDLPMGSQGIESGEGPRGGLPGPGSLELGGDFQGSSVALSLYMESVVKTVKSRWLPPSGAGRGIIGFTITMTGDIFDIHVVRSSGDKSLDESIIRAVKESGPLPEFPLELKQDLERSNDTTLEVKFYFRRRAS